MFPGESDDEFDEDLQYHENFSRGILNLGSNMRTKAAKKAHQSLPEYSSEGKTAKSPKKIPSSSPPRPPPPSYHPHQKDSFLLAMEKLDEYVRTESDPDKRIIDLILRHAASSQQDEETLHVRCVAKVVASLLQHVNQAKTLYTDQLKRVKEGAQASLSHAIQVRLY